MRSSDESHWEERSCLTSKLFAVLRDSTKYGYHLSNKNEKDEEMNRLLIASRLSLYELLIEIFIYLRKKKLFNHRQ